MLGSWSEESRTGWVTARRQRAESFSGARRTRASAQTAAERSTQRTWWVLVRLEMSRVRLRAARRRDALRRSLASSAPTVRAVRGQPS
jgi:hypothetical protein